MEDDKKNNNELINTLNNSGENELKVDLEISTELPIQADKEALTNESSPLVEENIANNFSAQTNTEPTLVNTIANTEAVSSPLVNENIASTEAVSTPLVNENIATNNLPAQTSYNPETTTENNTNVASIQDIKSNKKAKTKGHGKAMLAGCLVFGMAIGSLVSITALKDSIVLEVTNNIKNDLVIPASTSTDTVVNPVVTEYTTSAIVAKVTPSVVSIGILGAYSENTLAGAGTGVIFEEDSEKVYIITNNHVINGASGVKIWVDDSEEAVSAKLVGTNPENDLAVISIEKEDLAKIGVDKVSVCTFGNSDDIRVGDSVIAIGNAMGEGISSTGGMVSIKNKTISESSGNELNVIQTDAPINPGNSGGALVNSQGEIIGINTAKMVQTFSSTVEGVGYAIPANDVVEVIDEIFENASKPALGIRGFTIDEKTAELFSLPEMGVFVKDVSKDGSAYNAGIKPNDVITSFDDNTITDISVLQELIRSSKVGDTVKVKVFRDGEILTLDVTMLKHADMSF